MEKFENIKSKLHPGDIKFISEITGLSQKEVGYVLKGEKFSPIITFVAKAIVANREELKKLLSVSVVILSEKISSKSKI